jgi:hypothetical protein
VTDLPQVPVRVSTGSGLYGPIYLLTYVDPCEGCGLRHRHGGGDASEPIHLPLGTRVAHCPSSHRPFRDDCDRRKYTRQCFEQHMTGGVELVLADEAVSG